APAFVPIKVRPIRANKERRSITELLTKFPGSFYFCFSYVAKISHSCARNKEFPPFLGRVYDANVKPENAPA
ncbi:MAG TPA: hypothetical protein VK834_12295, partial [Bradyrhizobium sp.]|nr:hypothetical protein [Bradyrhizobium sp.]